MTEICPANASLAAAVRSRLIKPHDLLDEVKSIEAAGAGEIQTLKTRILELPVYYDDPWTRETLMRFRERHQDPSSHRSRIRGADQQLYDRRRFYCCAFRLALVRFHGRLRRRLPVHVSDGRTRKAAAGAKVRTAPNRHAETLRCPWWLLQCDLSRSWRRRLSDVRHHTAADLRSQSRKPASTRLHDPVSPRRHREMATNRS